MTITPRPKITYATLLADNEELHAAYEVINDPKQKELYDLDTFGEP